MGSNVGCDFSKGVSEELGINNCFERLWDYTAVVITIATMY